MPIQGLVRLRKHQFGRQADFGTAVPAAYAYPYSGTPEANLNWTDPDVDAGSIDPTASPTREAPELTFDGDIPVVYYNVIPHILSGFFGGGETGTGTPDVSWNFHPASETIDDPDPYTYEFGDDVTSDWFQFVDGIVESFEITAPEGLAALSASVSWRFGGVRQTGSADSPVTGTVPTPSLSVDIAGTPVYLKDCVVSIGDSPDYLTPIIDATYSWVLRGEHEIDEKRWANGSQTFDANALVPGARSIEFEATYAKTTDIVGLGSETDHWMHDVAVNRYINFTFTSLAEADTGTFYSWSWTMPARVYTRTEGEVGGNTAVILNAHAFYDPDDFEGVVDTTVVCTQASL